MPDRTTVRLPKELLGRAKRKALAEQRTLTSLIEEGLRLVVGENRKPAKRERRSLPLSTAVGPPRPGVDISNSAALQEMDDVDYIERLKNGFK
jgi:hypothetical protein